MIIVGLRKYQVWRGCTVAFHADYLSLSLIVLYLILRGGSESHAFLRLGKVLGVVRCTSDTVCATALTVSSRFAIFFFAVVLGSLPYNQGARIRACRMMVSRRFGRLFAWVANLTVKNHQVTRVSSFNYGINKGFGSVNISELSRGTARL